MNFDGPVDWAYAFSPPHLFQLCYSSSLIRGVTAVSAHTHVRYQSDFESGVDKQKNQLTLDLMDQNLALY